MDKNDPIDMGRDEVMEMVAGIASPFHGIDAMYRKCGGSGTGKAEHWYKDKGRIVKAFMIRATYQGRKETVDKVKFVPQRRYDMFVTPCSGNGCNAEVDLWILCGSKFVRIPYSLYGLREIWPEVYRAMEEMAE